MVCGIALAGPPRFAIWLAMIGAALIRRPSRLPVQAPAVA
jgi:hypothetical protein